MQQQGHFYAHAPMQAERKGILRPAVLRTQKSSTAQNPDLPGLLSLNRACSHHLHCSILNIPGFSFMYILHVNQPRLRFGEFSKAIQLSDPGTPTPKSLPTSIHTYNRFTPLLRVQKTSQPTERSLGKEKCLKFNEASRYPQTRVARQQTC